MTRSGLASSSRAKNNNSMLVALREKTLKLTPFALTVAPSGELCPAVFYGRPFLFSERSPELQCLGSSAGMSACDKPSTIGAS